MLMSMSSIKGLWRHGISTEYTCRSLQKPYHTASSGDIESLAGIVQERLVQSNVIDPYSLHGARVCFAVDLWFPPISARDSYRANGTLETVAQSSEPPF